MSEVEGVVMFWIVHKSAPNKCLYKGKTRHSAWAEMCKAENSFADNQKEFISIALLRGFMCKRASATNNGTVTQ